ncbi:hypothetical protein A3A38_02850 [Candidatus Kaiserbacteria bacterium RIFCSPLOWO2_01_FULL_53_17]|uniref:Uncharacterized protein n=1 Tax=Candidatus Kaiserbacteria bacterium RIFCSPLOWO2_01_FULL_53_17 TaxID=1798511 RepID=A0A1F6EG07_9BACT|nr:MAG: hypothetical protein A3A38_02850 [Candidatus Kaiserbacteria bacterium RIFCSPLOWO2_01_FULL_53_17]
MSTPVKYFAIFGLLVAGGLLVYGMFFKDSGAGTGALLTRESAFSGVESAAVTELLIVLKSLENLSLDTSVFDDTAFRSLKDYSVILDVVPQGKVNPFAPL